MTVNPQWLQPKYSRAEKLEFARKMRKAPTEAEAFLWEKLKRKQLGYLFQRQRTLYGFIVDFWCPKARLAIEVDGSVHDIFEIAAQDEKKEVILAGYKIGLLRFTNDEVMNSTVTVLRDIRRECDHLMQLNTPLKGVGFAFRGAPGGTKNLPSTNSRGSRHLENPTEAARNSRTRGPLPTFGGMCKSPDVTPEICGQPLITSEEAQELAKKIEIFTRQRSMSFPPDLAPASKTAWQQKQALSHWLQIKSRNKSA